MAELPRDSPPLPRLPVSCYLACLPAYLPTGTRHRQSKRKVSRATAGSPPNRGAEPEQAVLQRRLDTRHGQAMDATLKSRGTTLGTLVAMQSVWPGQVRRSLHTSIHSSMGVDPTFLPAAYTRSNHPHTSYLAEVP